jgi:hypothetical protein
MGAPQFHVWILMQIYSSRRFFGPNSRFCSAEYVLTHLPKRCICVIQTSSHTKSDKSGGRTFFCENCGSKLEILLHHSRFFVFPPCFVTSFSYQGSLAVHLISQKHLNVVHKSDHYRQNKTTSSTFPHVF